MSSVTELKSIVSGLKDSITDEGIQSLENAISEIRSSYENTPTVITLLKMLRALSKYIDAKKEGIHGDTWPLIDSVSDNLENLINDPEMDENSVNEIMSDQISEYRVFQQKIISNPAVSDEDIDKLREVILAIDWEITDATLSDFENVLTELIEKFRGYRIHYVFLKIIHTTGTYIGDQKASAPADSISFLRSVFEHFQEMVNADNISLEEKKEVLAGDLERFQEYKNSIYNSTKPAGTSQTDIESEPELEFEPETDFYSDDAEEAEAELESDEDEFDSDITPALSSFGSDDDSSDVEFVPLDEMPDEDDSLSSLIEGEQEDTGAPEPLPDDTEGEDQKDVMDDLFSVKETPADELLDAIHLMEVHGEKGEDQAMRMLDQSSGPQVGAKNLTAEKKDDAPIPEIDSRLDEFFSLDAPMPKSAGEVSELELESGMDDIPVEAEMESAELIPETEEEIEEETGAFEAEPDDGEDFEPDFSDTTVLNRLKITLETKESLEDSSILSSAGKDVQTLRELWEDDPQKLSLLDIITNLINFPEMESTEAAGGPPEIPTGATSEDTAEPSAQSDGVWGKIKSMFSR